MNRAAVLVCSALLIVSGPVQADPEPSTADRERALFGDMGMDAQSPDTTQSREAALFGDTESPATSPVPSDPVPFAGIDTDPLAIGGRLYLRSFFAIDQENDPLDGRLSTPALLDLYLDARPTSRLRAFAKARIERVFSAAGNQDATQADFGGCLANLPQTLSGPSPTLSTDDPTSSLCPTVTSGASENPFATQDQTRVQLDQLWLKFDLNRTVFVSVGQQRIKWGAARLWNPTDFINAERLDPLAVFDARLGVPLLKMHVPFEASGGNLYALALLDRAETLESIGGAVRLEWLVGPAEVTASAAFRKDSPLRLGADLSTGLGPLEVRIEGAVTHGGNQSRWAGTLDTERLGGQIAAWFGGQSQIPDEVAVPVREDTADEWSPQVVGSLEWGIAYGDDDTLYLTAEYFYNGAGYDDSELYPWLILQGDYVPLYAGRQYVGGSIVAPAPGRWDDSTFLVSTIGNLSDGSYITRFDYQYRALTKLTVYAFAAVHFGDEGEFNQGFTLPAVPGGPDLSVPAPFMDLGVLLSLSL